MWAAQEVVEGVEGVRRPGHGLLGAGVAGGAEARTHCAQALHVVHCAGHQVTWNRGSRTQIKVFLSVVLKAEDFISLCELFGAHAVFLWLLSNE